MEVLILMTLTTTLVALTTAQENVTSTSRSTTQAPATLLHPTQPRLLNNETNTLETWRECFHRLNNLTSQHLANNDDVMKVRELHVSNIHAVVLLRESGVPGELESLVLVNNTAVTMQVDDAATVLMEIISQLNETQSLVWNAHLVLQSKEGKTNPNFREDEDILSELAGVNNNNKWDSMFFSPSNVLKIARSNKKHQHFDERKENNSEIQLPALTHNFLDFKAKVDNSSAEVESMN